MVEGVISIEGDWAAGFDSVSIWGIWNNTIVASEVGIKYIRDLNGDSFIQSTWPEPGG
jgi:hypothetical protein